MKSQWVGLSLNLRVPTVNHILTRRESPVLTLIFLSLSGHKPSNIGLLKSWGVSDSPKDHYAGVATSLYGGRRDESRGPQTLGERDCGFW